MGETAIKIFGMERTCTNYVRELIERNTGVTVWVNTFGGKHALVDPEGWVLSGNWTWRDTYENSRARFAICVKDPYHWLVSIRRYCEKDPFYIPYDPERLLKRFDRMYLHWHWHLIDNRDQFFSEGGIVRYEDLLTYPESVLRSLGLEITEPFQDASRVRHSDKFTDERRAFYLSPVQDAEVIGLVNKYISRKFFMTYGYERIG